MSYARVPVLIQRRNYGMAGAPPLNERVSMGRFSSGSDQPLRENIAMGAVAVRRAPPLNERIAMGAVARRRPRPLNERVTMGDFWGDVFGTSLPGGGGSGQVFNTDSGQYGAPQAGPASSSAPGGGGGGVLQNIGQGILSIFGGGVTPVMPQQSALSLGTIVPILAIGGLVIVLLSRKKS